MLGCRCKAGRVIQHYTESTYATDYFINPPFYRQGPTCPVGSGKEIDLEVQCLKMRLQMIFLNKYVECVVVHRLTYLIKFLLVIN